MSQSTNKKHKYPLIEVTWHDSSSTTGWQTKPETELLECFTAGYLVHRNKRSIVVALNSSSKNSANSFGDTMTIPASCVKRLRRLR